MTGGVTKLVPLRHGLRTVAYIRELSEGLLPSSDEGLHAGFTELGVKLPLTTDPEYPESIVDGTGEIVCTIDAWRDRFTDDQAHRLAQLITLGVNFAAGA